MDVGLKQMTKTKLFIDTNIYLDYFRKSGESLSSLRELQKLLKIKKIELILPSQTKNEYLRRRNTIVEQTRKVLRERESELKLNLPAPFMREWKKESKSLQNKVTAAQKSYKKILKKYDTQVYGEKTPADILINKLLLEATIIEDDEAIIQRAYLRHLRGNPPRKNDGSYGDAIAWETLMEKASGANLAIITRDSDFSEERKGKPSFNSFLKKEWRQKNPKKKVIFCDSLGEFINTIEKREAVKKDIIQKEKAPELSFDSWLSYIKNVPSAGGGGGVVGGGGFSASLSQGGFGGSVLRGISPTFSLNFNTKSLKYCPYCAKDISTNLTSYSLMSSTCFGDSKFTCPYCQSQFDPGTLSS